MWKEMTIRIREVIIEMFEVTKENKCEPKYPWWRIEDVQKTINEKKKFYKCLHHHMSNENIQKDKEDRRNAKKIVSEAKNQAFIELYWK
jgi:hypothetical protein